ncbi:MAG: pSer/pThr/pTyr-binding forkhead associated (FHA) protein, partial [Pirellulaceae bacterium]
MRIKLIVLKGSNSGTEVKIPTPKCLIGRGDECHLRPKSDAISRRHCAILVKDSKVVIRDLKSRNGTYINGERLTGDARLKGGEHVRIGPLEFEVVIDHSFGGEKKPVVRDVKDAAARAAHAAAHDEDITDWLDEADEMDRERRMADPDTRQFKLDETDRVALESAKDAATAETKEQHDVEEEVIEVDVDVDAEKTSIFGNKKNKKEY